ncbi:MAG TPA: RluA family pseudouridine synthase [Planctomycetota bacterium]|nr:RluA family pseudouridine synthase [Planctomycetota bacterium]
MSISVMRLLREQHGLSDLTPIHRLDKDASGVLLFAKTKAAASALQRKWETVEKTYVALCENAPPQKSGTIDAPILEHQTGKPERLENALKYFRKTHPKIKLPPLPPPKTSSVHPAGRPSQTRYRVLEQFMTPRGTWSLLEVSPQQGRMHQIRVHLSYLGCALAIDPLYGKKEIADLPALTRVPLHAAKLVITHRGKTLTFDAPLAQDISRAIEDLKIASRMTGQLPG